MDSFFNTIYGWTTIYCSELDDYLYDKNKYMAIGLILVCLSLAICAFFYYVFKPVRRQTLWWWVCCGANMLLNFFVALGFTMTPLVNNKIAAEEEWLPWDCFLMGLSNVWWAFVAYGLIISLIIKWWSIDKYVHFKVF